MFLSFESIIILCCHVEYTGANIFNSWTPKNASKTFLLIYSYILKVLCDKNELIEWLRN